LGVSLDQADGRLFVFCIGLLTSVSKVDNLKIGGIIQVRMTSKRLPGKVLRSLYGKPMLQYLFESTVHCEGIEELIVATSTESTDDPIFHFCEAYGVSCKRGPLEDVAGRFAEIVQDLNLGAFVRINGDSPLLDYRLISRAVQNFKKGNYDIATNVLKRTFPKGQSVEVVQASTFLNAYSSMSSAYEREHVTPYFYARQSDFSIYNFESENDYGEIQLSVDSQEDMLQTEQLVAHMEKPHWEYTVEELVALVQELGGNARSGGVP